MTNQIIELISIKEETPNIKRFVFQLPESKNFSWSAGAHIRVLLPTGESRAYSLLDLKELKKNQIAIGVLLEVNSSGGSKYMHSLSEGDKIEISPPTNNFELTDGSSDDVLIAGGIGITPFLSMATKLNEENKSYTLHYAGRQKNSLAFVSDLLELCGENLYLHYDNDNSAINLRSIIENSSPGSHIYVCGPLGMIETTKDIAIELGLPNEKIKYELFKTDDEQNEDEAFEVQIHATGQIIQVSADQSIIDALEKAGLDPLYDCQRGDCGICQCEVISGTPDHRDIILTEEEKASNSIMQICVSRAKSKRLVIDI